MNNYFSHDSNARNSDKLLPVRMKFGAEGYGIYFMILERLREEKNYMSIKDYNMLAFDLRVDTSKIKAIVEDFGLFAFTDNGECFYSEGFNKRMEIKDEKSKKKSEAGKKGANKRWQKNGSAIAMPSEENSNANSNTIAVPSKKIASKEKESKEKKVNNISPTTPKKAKSAELESNFEKLWNLYPRKERKADAFKAYKKAIKAGTTNKEIQDGIIAYARAVVSTDKQYIAQGGTWFNQQRWQDVVDEPVHRSYQQATPSLEYNLDEVEKAYEQ